MGAEAIKELLRRAEVDKLSEELREKNENRSFAPEADQVAKRLKVLEALPQERHKPEWMILDVIPGSTPELRAGAFDGGRFATSDLNDLFRRVINRNNRLKKLMELRRADVIVRNEKRMLQEAVDALLTTAAAAGSARTNNRRSSPSAIRSRASRGVSARTFSASAWTTPPLRHRRRPGTQAPPMRSAQEDGARALQAVHLSQARSQGHCTTIKQAKEMVEHRKRRWDILETHPRTSGNAQPRPDAHRLGIQASNRCSSKAKHPHPPAGLPAFNADFDGDQMAVHIPLSPNLRSRRPCSCLILAMILSPAHGLPLAVPSQDMVLASTI